MNMTSYQKNTLIVSSSLLVTIIFYFLFVVYSKATDSSLSYLLVVFPSALGSIVLLVLSSFNEDKGPSLTVLLLSFLLISGNAYQIVLGANDPLKIFLLNIIALIGAATSLTLYITVIKKRLLTNKKGYRIAISAVGGTILFLFLLLLIFGTDINGARLWLIIGPLSLEITEIIKLLFYVFIALIYNSNLNVREKILFGVVALGVSSLFLALLNEFGTVIILFCVYLISFYLHVRANYSLLMIGGIVIVLAIALAIIYSTHDQLKESEGFFADKLNKIYARLNLTDTDQARRALQGMMNGGLFGAGSDYIIEYYSIEADFALAGMGEYLGIVIMLLCIFSVGAIVYLVYLKGKDDMLNNRSRYKLSFIFTTAIAVQTALSLCGNIGLPCAGVGMPGISAGGTQMLAFYIEAAFMIYGIQSEGSINSRIIPEHRKIDRRNFYVEDEIQEKNDGCHGTVNAEFSVADRCNIKQGRHHGDESGGLSEQSE